MSVKNTESYFQRCVHDRKNPYVMISREMAQDKSISPKAKGVLLYLLSLPPDWKIYHSQLQDGLGVGEDYVNSAMQELLDQGYAERTRERVNGTFQPYNYIIREFKKCLPNRENRPGSSGPVNPGLQSKEETSSLQKKQQQQAAPAPAAVSFSKKKIDKEKPMIYPVLEKVDIPEPDKIEVTKNYSEEDVTCAVRWATHPSTVITKGLPAAIKWACKVKPAVPGDKSENELLSKTYTLRYDNMSNEMARILVMSNCVEFAYHSQREPLQIKFSENGFIDQFHNALRKSNFKIIGS